MFPHTAQKSIRFLISARVASDPRVWIFNFLFFFLLWNDVQLIAAKIAGSNGILPCMLCFKQPFHIGVWMFVRFVTILCIWEIWSPRIHVLRISQLAKKKRKKDYRLMTRLINLNSYTFKPSFSQLFHFNVTVVHLRRKWSMINEKIRILSVK